MIMIRCSSAVESSEIIIASPVLSISWIAAVAAPKQAVSVQSPKIRESAAEVQDARETSRPSRILLKASATAALYGWDGGVGWDWGWSFSFLISESYCGLVIRPFFRASLRASIWDWVAAVAWEL